MHSQGQHDLPSWDTADGGDPEDDPGQELEAAIEREDRPFASEGFGTTEEEAEEGESLDQRLAEERPDRGDTEDYVGIEDQEGGDEELVGQASSEHDPLVAPEEAAVTIRQGAPGGIDRPPDPTVDEE